MAVVAEPSFSRQIAGLKSTGASWRTAAVPRGLTPASTIAGPARVQGVPFGLWLGGCLEVANSVPMEALATGVGVEEGFGLIQSNPLGQAFKSWAMGHGPS